MPFANMRLSRLVILLVGVLMLINAIAALVFLSHGQEAALKAKWRENANLANALQEQTARVLASADQVTLRLAEQVREQASMPDLARLVSESSIAPKILVQLSLVAADGHFIASNIDPSGSKTGPVDLSEREHIRVHLHASANEPQTYIAKPVLGKVSKRWTIQLSRRISAADGRLLGVAVASLDPAYFEEVYAKVDLGRQGTVSLIGHDLSIRAQVVAQASQGMGSHLEAHHPLVAPLAGPSGQLRLIDPEDHNERIVAFQQVSPYPLSLVVSASAADTLDNWRGTRHWLLALVAVLTLTLAGALLPLLRRLRRLEGEHAELLASAETVRAAQQTERATLMAVCERLRTPVTRLLGCAALLKKQADTPASRQPVQEVQQAADQLACLLDNLVELAQIEAGTLELQWQMQDLEALVHSVAEPQRTAAQAKSLAMRIHFDPDAPRHLRCDAQRLRQILSQLLINALRFTTRGEVAIEIDAVPGAVRIHVADTGPGMPAAISEHFRSGQGALEPQHSKGLGLTLLRQLARYMGGELQLSSVEGLGTRFTLSLPLPD